MKQLLTLVFLCLFLACSQKPQDEALISLIPIDIDSPLLMSSISKKMDFLEIKSESPIAGTPRVFIGDSYYYLFDQDFTTSLYQIDKNGTILNTIQFGVDDRINSNSITNLILKNNKIGIIQNGLNLTWLDENLKEDYTETLLVKASFQFPYKNEYLAFTNWINDDLSWDFVTYTDTINYVAIPLDDREYKFSYETSAPFSIWKGLVLFTKYFNDTVYSYSEQRLKPLFIVDFGSSKVPDGEFLRIENAMDMMKFFGQKKYTYLSGDIFSLSNDLIMAEFIEKGNRKIGIWSESKNTFTTYLSFYDDLLSNITLYTPSVVKDKQLAFGVTGESILENYNELSPAFKSNLSEEYSTSYFIFLADLN
ncbi:6-bladed beta-propeller [Algoriphagus antarcticus]|uniref:6-bladed beta-propeller protein n=1 Tax=Algoriphagus antarcticus TaxID=238540 RepID=A0A3E0D9R3_9BACT|nr:6-bladed beta-propeller [Algoriphagus antarcticus]REG79409.1 hypothetical protein C8N25_13239 [Algoriphagus antarcticus]